MGLAQPNIKNLMKLLKVIRAVSNSIMNNYRVSRDSRRFPEIPGDSGRFPEIVGDS